MSDDHGEFGYLTTAQWRSFQWAVSYSFALVPFLRSAGNYSISVDEGGNTRAVEPALGMPATLVTAIEIERLAKELGEWDNLEDIANDVFGADIANLFAREVSIAAHRWPMEDRPHEVENVRCTHCGMIALVYRPPVTVGDDTTIRCEECGESEDEETFSTRLALMRHEMETIRLAS